VLLLWTLFSQIRSIIAPALGIERTEALLQAMTSANFVTTVDIAVKLVSLASLIRAGGSLIMSGPTGTGALLVMRVHILPTDGCWLSSLGALSSKHANVSPALIRENQQPGNAQPAPELR
jgi:hypothetical protein